MSNLKTIEPADASNPPKSKSVVKSKPVVQSWRWQGFLAPLMGVSIVLHLALLLVPLPTSTPTEESTEAEAEPAVDTAAPIDILSLSDIVAPEPPPEAPSEQPIQAPPPDEAPPPPPDPTQVPETLPEATFVEPLPIDDGSLENTQPSFDPAAAIDQFLGKLSGLNVQDDPDQRGDLPEPVNFRNPGHAGCFIDPTGGPKPGVRVIRWLDKEPHTLFRKDLQEAFSPQGITFEEQPPYCGERYLRAITAEGQPFMTLSLATLQASTLLVVWDVPPQ